MSKIGVSEWMWRYLALAMLFAVSWTLWVVYQLSPPPFVTNAAFEAASVALQKRIETPGAQGKITPPTGAEDPAKSADAGTASAPAEDPAKPADAATASAPAEAAPKAIAAAPSSAEPAKPAPEQAPAEKPVAAKTSDAEIIEAVQAWAKAWSSKDVDAYLASYARDFKPSGSETRAEWEKSRRQRINAPKSITVKLDAFKVSLAAEGRASVSFRQDYRSDVVDPIVTAKTLVMAKSDGRWLIQQEKSGN